MEEKFLRNTYVLGEENVLKLKEKRVLLFGIGGVGGHAAEALIRSGIGALTIVDFDVVSESNINRQLVATTRTVGKLKTEVLKQRLLEINPDCEIVALNICYSSENQESIRFASFDYVIDAIDMVSGKMQIIENANQEKIPVISAMGAGNKTDPTQFEVSDIYKTSVCPLAKVVRRECKNRRIKKLKVVYSKELPTTCGLEQVDGGRKRVPGSLPFVPSVVGLIIAREVVMDLIKEP